MLYTYAHLLGCEAAADALRPHSCRFAINLHSLSRLGRNRRGVLKQP